MTAFSLPRIQAANPPAIADSSKDIAAGNGTADGGNFQQVLAKQAQKSKPEAPAEKPVQPPAAQNKPTESAKNDNTAEQAEAETTENIVPGAKKAAPDADVLS
jgi:hypothetical protein